MARLTDALYICPQCGPDPAMVRGELLATVLEHRTARLERLVQLLDEVTSLRRELGV